MDGLDNLRVASFSAYLNPADQESFALKLAAVVQEAVPAVMPPAEMETPRAVSFRRTKPEKESEIDIFGADKYFNIKMEYKSPKSTDGGRELTTSHCNDNSIRDREKELKPKMSTVTTSVCTESSWNSQIPILPTLHGNSSRSTKPKRSNGRGGNFFKGFGCHGPCRGNKEESKQMVSDSSKSLKSGKSQEQFAFPILNVKNDQNPPMMLKKLSDDPRNSIEVFGSQKVKKGDEMNQMIAKNLERKLSMLTWDAIPKKSSPYNFPTIKPTAGAVEEAMSDASSDLFEIETLSGIGLPYLTVPQETDDASGCMTPTTLYEPSEASIEWSVVTASAANDFSFASDFDDRSMAGELNLIPMMNRNVVGTKNLIMAREGHKNKGGLLGCKSQKAVSVVEIPVIQGKPRF